MRILLTNDDGVLAPGLAAMCRVLLSFGEVVVVAPQSPASGTSHAITLSSPIHVATVRVDQAFDAYAVYGTPADCVKIGLSRLVSGKPDMVVSGINDGANASSNVLYSGTVAAAAEGAFLKIPSFAVSLQRGGKADFDLAADIARTLIEFIHEKSVQPGLLTNINIPPLESGPPRGVRVARQGCIHILDTYDRIEAPDGRDYYWLGGDFDHLEDTPDSDLHGLEERYVTVTPLQFDLTHYEERNRMSGWSFPDVSSGPVSQ